MHTVRADIANRRRQAGGDLALHVQVILHHVITVRVRLNVGVLQTLCGVGRGRSVRELALKPTLRIEDCKEWGSPAVQSDCRI